jgi:hypothetical protein
MTLTIQHTGSQRNRLRRSHPALKVAGASVLYGFLYGGGAGAFVWAAPVTVISIATGQLNGLNLLAWTPLALFVGAAVGLAIGALGALVLGTYVAVFGRNQRPSDIAGDIRILALGLVGAVGLFVCALASQELFFFVPASLLGVALAYFAGRNIAGAYLRSARMPFEA